MRGAATLTYFLTFSLGGLAACQKPEVAAVVPVKAPAPEPPPFQMTASIQELMDAIIDPSADALWDSVSITNTLKGTEFRQPRTDDEWQEARRHAIALIEGTNLLIMDGRKLVAPGSAVLDQNIQGVLSADEGQKKFDAQHAAFVQFARALREAGAKMLSAIDKRDAAGMMDAGAAMDGVCEGCHLTFWYPNQVIPPLPADFGTPKSGPAPKRIPLSPG
ncbi:MAG TPA: hypothetical protein VGI65_11535 [Steroidobacteraceae bacterium]|jgi:hypothetical protein